MSLGWGENDAVSDSQDDALENEIQGQPPRLGLVVQELEYFFRLLVGSAGVPPLPEYIP